MIALSYRQPYTKRAGIPSTPFSVLSCQNSATLTPASCVCSPWINSPIRRWLARCHRQKCSLTISERLQCTVLQLFARIPPPAKVFTDREPLVGKILTSGTQNCYTAAYVFNSSSFSHEEPRDSLSSLTARTEGPPYQAAWDTFVHME